MDKVSGYVVANSQGGYDVISKISQTSSKKIFTIPNLDEDIAPKNSVSAKVGITKTESIKLPDNMLTKTEPTRSDEEILKDIEELAKEHAKTGEFQDSDPRFWELMNEFISSVSPDREGIIKNSTDEIYERIASEVYPEKLDEEDKKEKKELIDFFMEAIGASKSKDKYDNDIISSNIATRGNNIATGVNTPYNITSVKNNGDHTVMKLDYGGGKTTTLIYNNVSGELVSTTMKGNKYHAGCIENNTLKTAEYYDDNGEWIALYANGKVTTFNTKAESERRAVMNGVYNAAYDFSIGRYNQHEQPNINGTMLTNFNGIGNTNALIKEIYDSTYERLRSEMA